VKAECRNPYIHEGVKIMNCLLVLTLAIESTVCADPKQPDAMKVETRKLEGVWVVESAAAEAKLLEKERGGTWRFAGDSLSIRAASGEQEREGLCAIDPTRTPKTIDLRRERQCRLSCLPDCF
jgi:hypothetical protein